MADLTPDEGAPFEAVARDVGLAVVYLVAPTTPAARRAAIAARSGGFLYCVSLVGVTGARTSLPASVGRLVRDVKAASPVPVGVGFGVSKPAHVRAIAAAGADGVIVASALVDALGPDGRDVDGSGRPRHDAPRRDRGDLRATVPNLEPEQPLRRPAPDELALLLRQSRGVRQRPRDVVDLVRPVRPEHDPVRPDDRDQVAQRAQVVGDAVVVDPAQVVGRSCAVIRRRSGSSTSSPFSNRPTR